METRIINGKEISAFVKDGCDKFTISYTMATTDNNTPKPPFAYVSLRVSNTSVINKESGLSDVGMLYLIRGEYQVSEIRTGTAADGSGTKYSDAMTLINPGEAGILNGTNNISNNSDFFTVSMVITLAGDSGYGTIDYYIDGKFVTSVNHYASDNYFENKGVYLCLYMNGSNNAYRSAIKNVVVTPGDIVNDYN